MRDKNVILINLAIIFLVFMSSVIKPDKIFAEEQEVKNITRAAVTLTDNSYIIGILSLPSLPFQTSYAKFDIPVEQISNIKFQSDGKTVFVELYNKDKLTGVINLTSLELETIFGKVSINTENINKIMLVNNRIIVGSRLQYNATLDFSIRNGNPNGVWSYGWMPKDFNMFNLYTGSQMNISSPQWYREPRNEDYTPMIWRIDDDSSRCGVAVGQLSLHPSSTNEASVLRWTAASDGVYNFNGQFFRGDTGIMKIGIRHGSDWLWQGSDAGIFNFERSVKAGESIDFLVYGGYGSGNTPLELTILKLQ
ncbi:MAG: hypothetical protein AB1498_00320 [bacterium]